MAIQLEHEYGFIWCFMGNLGLMMIDVFSPGMGRDKYVDVLHYNTLCKSNIYLNIGKRAVFIRKQTGFREFHQPKTSNHISLLRGAKIEIFSRSTNETWIWLTIRGLFVAEWFRKWPSQRCKVIDVDGFKDFTLFTGSKIIEATLIRTIQLIYLDLNQETLRYRKNQWTASLVAREPVEPHAVFLFGT